MPPSPTRSNRIRRRVVLAVELICLAVTLGGCIVAPYPYYGNYGYGYYRPYRHYYGYY